MQWYVSQSSYIHKQGCFTTCSFSDIDECSEDISGCEQTYTNTVGSYYCSCKTGFVLSASDDHGCEGKYINLQSLR